MEAHAALGTNTRPSGFPARAAVLPDERLAWQVARGSERAFAALYHRYHQQLFRYCRSMLRDEADAQDALQSTFAAAFAALRQARRDAPLRPWLFRIAHNEAINIMRRRRPHSELVDGLACGGAAVEEQAEQHERLARLVADLRQLPQRQRAALIMRELSGLSHEEIAVALECSVGSAKQTIYEARRALAEYEEGRMTSCDEICHTISNADRRALRGRKVRAHLRGCAACSAFAAAIPTRSADLHALAPVMPPAATAMVLGRLLAEGASHGSGAGAMGAGAASKATVALSGAKAATTVALAATATLGVAAVLRQQHLALRAHERSAAPHSVVSRAGHRSQSGVETASSHRLSSTTYSDAIALTRGRVVRSASPALVAGQHAGAHGGAATVRMSPGEARHITSTAAPTSRHGGSPPNGTGGFSPPGSSGSSPSARRVGSSPSPSGGTGTTSAGPPQGGSGGEQTTYADSGTSGSGDSQSSGGGDSNRGSSDRSGYDGSGTDGSGASGNSGSSGSGSSGVLDVHANSPVAVVVHLGNPASAVTGLVGHVLSGAQSALPGIPGLR